MRELQKVNADLQSENEELRLNTRKVEFLQNLVEELKSANVGLERKLASMCEAPFISDAFEQHDLRAKFDAVRRERDALVGQVQHLQEAVRTNFSALTSLKQQAASLRDEKDELKRERGALLERLDENNKGRPFSVDDIDTDTIEKALTVVKRREITATTLPFLENPNVNDEQETLLSLRRKLEDQKLICLRLTEDNERLESMLTLQAKINDDVHRELDQALKARGDDQSVHIEEKHALESLALQRLEKIHRLEAQLREVSYSVANRPDREMRNTPNRIPFPSSPYHQEDPPFHSWPSAEDSSLIGVDDNLVEVWIRGASITEDLPPGSSTFIVVDFFDYESQASPLLSGKEPKWDFSITYKVKLDDFLFRFLSAGSLNIDLNVVSLIQV